MAKAVPTVEVELDKVRTLRMDLNALEAFEDAAGKQIGDIGDNPAIKDIKLLVWACLQSDSDEEDSPITPKDVGSWLHPGNLPEVMDLVTGLLAKND